MAIEDEGDHIVLRPVPDDPVDALRGVFRAYATGRCGAEAVRASRDEDVDAGEAKWSRHRTG